jgi:hypothetical protein
MATRKLPPLKQTLRIRRAPEHVADVEIKISATFDPESIGPERTEAIFTAIRRLIEGLMTPAELKRFAEKLERERQKLGTGGKI